MAFRLIVVWLLVAGCSANPQVQDSMASFSGHSTLGSSAFDALFYIGGEWVNSQGSYYFSNSIWSWTLKSGWEGPYPSTGAAPPLVEVGAAVLSSNSSYCFYYGGRYAYSSNLYVYDFATLEWSIVAGQSKTHPIGVEGATMISWAAHGAGAPDNVLLYGGDYYSSGHFVTVSDLWLFDWSLPADQAWTQIPQNVSKQWPPALSGHSSLLYKNSLMITYGGGTNDVWTLDINTYQWTVVTTTGTRPSSRSYHSAVIRDDTMIIFGGSASNCPDQVCNDLWSFDIPTSTWAQITPKGGSAPSGRSRQAVALIENSDGVRNQLIINGGYDWYRPIDTTDVYVFDLDTLMWTIG